MTNIYFFPKIHRTVEFKREYLRHICVPSSSQKSRIFAVQLTFLGCFSSEIADLYTFPIITRHCRSQSAEGMLGNARSDLRAIKKIIFVLNSVTEILITRKCLMAKK